MNSNQKWNRVRRPRKRHHFPREPPMPPPLRFVRVLAMYAGSCGICNRLYQIGEPIYWCRKTRTTRAMRCHANCYLARMQAFTISNSTTTELNVQCGDVHRSQMRS
jgi:hypothetical protein